MKQEQVVGALMHLWRQIGADIERLCTTDTMGMIAVIHARGIRCTMISETPTPDNVRDIPPGTITTRRIIVKLDESTVLHIRTLTTWDHPVRTETRIDGILADPGDPWSRCLWALAIAFEATARASK